MRSMRCAAAIPTMSPFPFLELPIELRFQIYGYVAEAVPRSAPMIKFAGLYLSCRQIKEEFEDEYMKAYTRYTTELASTLRRSRLLAIPTTFATAQRLAVQISKGVHMHHVRNKSRVRAYAPLLKNDPWDTIKPVLGLHLHTLEVHLRPARLWPASWSPWIVEVLFEEMKKPEAVNVKQLSVVVQLTELKEVEFTKSFHSKETLGNDWLAREHTKIGEDWVYSWERA
jgi:hypothetical protein